MPEIQNIPTTQYVGPRIIPHLWDPIQWDDTTQYDALAVVQYDGAGYVSRYVPPQGTAPTDTRYWVRWADFNAQLAQVQQQVSAASSLAEDAQEAATAAQTSIDTLLPSAAFSVGNTVQDYIDARTEKLDEDFYVVSSIADASAYANYRHVYQCTGTNDEAIIQQAINDCAEHGGTVHLSRGDFFIDSFPNVIDEPSPAYAAISIPHKGSEVCISGDSLRLSGSTKNGTVIYLSDACYEALSDNLNYRVFSSPYEPDIVSHVTESVRVENLNVILPWNQKRIIVFDWFSFERVYMQFVLVNGYRNGYNGHNVTLTNPPDKAVAGSAGIRMTSGSNAGLVDDYFNVGVVGLYEGFKVGGEHVVMVNCAGIYNVYAYTFGNYEWVNGGHHPITLINCCDEKSVNLPRFVKSGNDQGRPQEVDLIGFNIERISAATTPGGVLGNFAVVEEGQNFCGNIWFTIQTSYSGAGNSVTQPFWEGTNGRGFITRNMAQKPSGPSSERYNYAPAYLQTYYDTDLESMLVCVDEVAHTWRYWEKSVRVALTHSAALTYNLQLKHMGTMNVITVQSKLAQAIADGTNTVLCDIPARFKPAANDINNPTSVGLITGTVGGQHVSYPCVLRILNGQLIMYNRSGSTFPSDADISGELVYSTTSIVESE